MLTFYVLEEKGFSHNADETRKKQLIYKHSHLDSRLHYHFGNIGVIHKVTVQSQNKKVS